jgi:PIN domain nuclease of toxin-antitoxin system
MKFLLDTHFVIWIPIDDRRISRTARALLTNPQHEFVFSSASLWEIAIMRTQKGMDFAYDPRGIRRQMVANGYEELAIDGLHAVSVDTLPPIHKDPFDRLLIAQATVEGITLLTADATIAKYPGPIRKV